MKPPLHFTRFFLQILAVGTLLALQGVSRLQAQAVYDFTAITGTPSWNTTTNWNPNLVPNAAGVIANITSNITAATTLNLDGSKTVGMLFLGDPTSSHVFTIAAGSGGSLVFNNSTYGYALLSKTNGTQTDVISAPITLASNLNINTNVGTNGVRLNISGPISGNGFRVNIMGYSGVTFTGSAANTYDGLTTVFGRGVDDSGTPTLLLQKSAGVDAIRGNLQIGNASMGGNGRSMVYLGADNQINNNSIITFDSVSSNNAYLQLMGFQETVRGIVDYGREGVIQVSNTQTGIGNSTLGINTLAGDNFYYSAYFRNNAGSGGTGILSVSVTGAGTQTLAGDRIQYTGTTTIGSGATLIFETTNTGTLNAGFNSGFNSSGTSVQNDGTLGIRVVNNGLDQTFSKQILGNGGFTRYGNGILRIDSVGSGGGAVTFGGAGVKIFGGRTVFNKATTVTAGGFSVDGLYSFQANATQVTWSSTMNVAGGVKITGYNFGSGANGNSVTPSITANGAATITSGNLDLEGGLFVVQNGTLNLTGGAINISDNVGELRILAPAAAVNRVTGTTAPAVNMNGGKVAFLAQAGGSTVSQTFGTLTLQGGLNLIETNNTAANSTLTFGNFSRSAGGMVNFLGSGLGTNANKVLFTSGVSATATIMGGWATVGTAGSPTDWAQYTANGVVAYTSYNTGAIGTWNTTTNNGNVAIASNQGAPAGNVTINSLKFVTADSTLNMGTFKLTLNSGGILANRNSTINGTGTIGITSATDELFYYSSSGITTTINAIVGNTTSRMSFVKGGSGAVILAGVNTFTGDTIVNEGIVTINAETGLGNSSAGSSVILNGGTLRGNQTLTIDDVGRTVILGAGDGAVAAANTMTMTISSAVTSQNGGRLLFDASVANWNGNVLLNGALNLAGGVESFGDASTTGKLTLQSTGTGTIGGIRMFTRTVEVLGTNNITKDIYVRNGLLQLGGVNTFSGAMILDGGTTRLLSSTALNTPVAGAGFELTMAGGAIFDTNGFNTTVSSLVSSSQSAEISGANGVANTFTVNQSASTTYAGRISQGGSVTGTLQLIKKGSGSLTLSGIVNSYRGGTRIEGGTINVLHLAGSNASGSLGNSVSGAASDLVLAGGALRYIGNSALGQLGITDRSFTLGAGADAGAIVADGVGRGSVMKVGLGVLSFAIGYEGSGNRSLTLGGSNRGDNIFNLLLADGPGGVTSLRKIGTGNWIIGDSAFSGFLNQANSYSGITEVLSGSLVTIVNGGFGTGKVIVSGGTGGQSAPNWINATLELRNVLYTQEQELSLNGGTLAARGISSWAGKVLVGANSNFFVADGGQLTLNGTALGGGIGGTGSITQYGNGAVVISNVLLDVRNTGNASNDAASYTVISGTLVLNYGGASSSYGSDGIDGSKLSDTAALVLGGSRFGGKLIMSGTRGSNVVEIVKSLTLNAGQNKISRDTTTGNNAIIRLNTITRNSGATLDFSDENIASADNGLTNGILGPWATISGTDWATKSGIKDDGSPTTGDDARIVRYTGYLINNTVNAWVATGNMDVKEDNTQAAGASAYTLRFHTADTSDNMMTITLAGAANLSSGGAILVTSAMGTSDAVIKGGSLSTSAADFLIYQNNPSASLLISSVLTGGVGMDKIGPGELLLYGLNNYTGVTLINAGVTGIKTFGDVNVASGLGSASNAIDRLVFNGGTLQLNSAGGVSNSGRGYTVNDLAVWDIGNENTTLNLTGQYATGGTEAAYVVKKAGTGTLQLSGTRNTGYGITEWQVADGTVRWITGNTDNKFAQSEEGKLTMMGGTLEVYGGGTDATRTQFLQGNFTVGTGASTIRVRSTTNQTAALSLQRESDPQPITWGRGGSILFIEDSFGGGFARIIIAAQTGIDQEVILPRALYQDANSNTTPGVNGYAIISANGNAVTLFDFHANNVSNVSTWAVGVSDFYNASDASSETGGFFGSITANRSVNTLRFWNNADPTSIITIDSGARLNIIQGAILTAQRAGRTQKKITGDGTLTSSLSNSQDSSADLLIHNWNPMALLELDVSIVDNSVASQMVNLVQSGIGTTSLSKANSYTGWTYLHGGVLLLNHASALPTVSHVQFHNGILGLGTGNSDFSWSVGTGNGQVDWAGSGGFAAYGANATVALGGTTSLVWGKNGFVLDNTSLVFGAHDSTHTVDFKNNIELGFKDRMVRTDNGTAEIDGKLSGVITGKDFGTLVKSGFGGLELSGANTYLAGTQLAQGLLLVSHNSGLGGGGLLIGGTNDSRAADRVEFRFSGTSLGNAITVGKSETTPATGNYEGISTIRSTSNTQFAGPVTLNRNAFLSVASGTTASYSSIASAASNAGRATVVGGGTVRLTGANANFNYNSGATGNTSAVNGGMTIRSGSVLVDNSGGLGTVTVELGDANKRLNPPGVVYATTGRSVLGVENNYATNAVGIGTMGGAFVANANGSGVLNIDRAYENVGAGNGAFYGISATLDGHLFTGSDVGVWILVKDEVEYPERNGVYRVVQINSDGTMNITRVSEFDAAGEMTYGTQLAITAGVSNSGKTFFMASPSITTPNNAADPSYWEEDVLNPAVKLLANNSGVNISNAIDINANGSGDMIIGTETDFVGGSGDAVSFNGNVVLQDGVVGTAELKTLILSSADGVTSGQGVLFSGVFSEASGVGANADILSLSKKGNGVATLSANNTYHGATAVDAGTLRITHSNALGAADGTAGTGTVIVSGATLEIDGTSGNVAVGNEALSVGGAGVSSGGAVKVTGGNNSWNGAVTMTSDTTVNVVTSAALKFASTVTGNFALTKQGAGTLELTGTNTYQGNTSVNAGRLLVNNSAGSGTGTGAVTFASGSILGGGGAIVAGLNNSVTLNSGSTLVIGNTGALAAEDFHITTSGTGVITLSGTIQFDLFTSQAGVNPVTANDRLVLTGSLNTVLSTSTSVLQVSSSLTVDASNYTVGRTWDLIDWTTLASGTFSNILATQGNFAGLPDLSSLNLQWDFSNLYTNGSISVVAVPEPGRFALLVVAVGLVVLRRRRK